MSSVVPNAKQHEVIECPNRSHDNGRLLTSQRLSQGFLEGVN